MSTLTAILRRSRLLLALFLLLELIGSGVAALEPSYLQTFVSAVVDGFVNTPHPAVVWILLMLALVHVVAAAAAGLSSVVMAFVSAGILKDLRMAFFAKMSRLPIAYFREVDQGEFVTKFNMDISAAEHFLSETVPQLFFNALMSVAIFAILMATCNTTLTLLGLLVAVLSALLVVWLNRLLEHLAESLRDSYSDINRVFDETVEGIDTLKIFAREGLQGEKFERHNEQFRKLSVASGRLAALFLPFIDLTLKLGNLVILMLVYSMITAGSLDRDSFLRFFFYLAMFQGCIHTVTGTLTSIQPTLVSLRRLQALFAEEEEEEACEEGDGASCEIPTEVSLEVEDLTFSWPSGRPIFERARLSLPAGRTLHVVGPSGAGKTTLINLLLRFYEPQEGRILINGRDVRSFPLRALRSLVSVVTQDHFVFEEPLRDNLALADPKASDEAMLEALRKANLSDWFRSLPEGLDTVMGTRGKTISGGERQRVCIARAFLKKAPLVVLDEPFANVDDDTRGEIVKAIANLRKEATLLIISHQPVDDAVVDERVFLDPQALAFVEWDGSGWQAWDCGGPGPDGAGWDGSGWEDEGGGRDRVKEADENGRTPSRGIQQGGAAT